jgi:outer membrane protein OmpA-like peptidoglycan-associated protein
MSDGIVVNPRMKADIAKRTQSSAEAVAELRKQCESIREDLPQAMDTNNSEVLAMIHRMEAFSESSKRLQKVLEKVAEYLTKTGKANAVVEGHVSKLGSKI